MFGGRIKFSSWLAGCALIGRSTTCEKKNWKDAALLAIIAKNEVLSKGSAGRNLIENGATDGEIREEERMLNEELAKQEKISNSKPPQTRLQALFDGFRNPEKYK